MLLLKSVEYPKAEYAKAEDSLLFTEVAENSEETEETIIIFCLYKQHTSIYLHIL